MNPRSVFISCVLLAACGQGARSPIPAPDLLEHSIPAQEVTGRGEFAGLKVRVAGSRTVALEVAIDATEGFRRRIVARDGKEPGWTFSAAADELLSDFALHPSGEVTVAVEVLSRARGGYELVRLNAGGTVRGRSVLDGAAIPASDFGTTLTLSELAMRSREPHALTDGWVRVEAHGDDVAAAWLTRIDAPQGGGPSPHLALGVSLLELRAGALGTAWSRIVEGRHSTEPAAWAYDEFRWREAAVRPLLAVAEDGTVVVARSWNQQRCLATSRTFGEVTEAVCRQSLPGAVETEYLPIAITSFDIAGTRLGTSWYVPPTAAEFVAFDIDVRGSEIAIAGSIVHANEDGSVNRYPAEPGSEPIMVPYDGYLGVLDRKTGAVRCERAIDPSARGDHLASVRWQPDGTMLAAGAAGWDRWYGGMSISRGSEPWMIAVRGDCAPAASAVVPFAGRSRHHELLSIDKGPDRIVGVGLTDAPLTHSGDGGQIQERMFGGLRLELR